MNWWCLHSRRGWVSSLWGGYHLLYLQVGAVSFFVLVLWCFRHMSSTRRLFFAFSPQTCSQLRGVASRTSDKKTAIPTSIASSCHYRILHWQQCSKYRGRFSEQLCDFWANRLWHLTTLQFVLQTIGPTLCYCFFGEYPGNCSARIRFGFSRFSAPIMVGFYQFFAPAALLMYLKSASKRRRKEV